MELKNLRTFQTVVDQGSYQKAAERLGYTQSTITVQISWRRSWGFPSLSGWAGEWC